MELLAGEAKVSAKVRKKTRRKEGVGTGASCADLDVLPVATNVAVVTAATLCLLNGERADKGLGSLVENAKLAESSLGHSKDMVANSYFAHEGRNGADVVDRVKTTGYLSGGGRWSVGENLAWGTGTLATPRGIVTAWMNSQGHRDNIMRGDYEEIGFGVVVGNPKSSDGQGATYTTNFGVVEGDSPGASATPSASGTPSATVQARRSISRRLRTCRAKAVKARSAKKRKACASIARRARAAAARR